MALSEQDIKRISVAVIVLILGILVYLILKPVLLSIIGGLILAYIFFPVYKWVSKRVSSPILSAAIVSIIVILIIAIPLWFLLPMMSQQIFEFFKFTQELDLNGLIRTIFPSASEQMVSQIDATASKALSQLTSSALNTTVGFLVNFAVISLHLLLVAFVFFFALKDESKLREFVSGLSPLNKTQEGKLVKQFKDTTESLIYGQVVAGILQGVFAGIGFYAFGVPNALILTVAATIFGVIPIIGPSFVYIPVAVYMIFSGNHVLALAFLLYNVIIVSSVDTIFRSHFVSKRTSMSQAIILIGMVGGLLIFGILGLIIGPLILVYFITFLKAYKDKTLSSLFSP